MKNIILQLALYAIIITGIALKPGQSSTISGRVNPPDAAESIWAFMGTDSVKTVAGIDGNFQLKAKPGVWRVVVAAKPPYKNVQIEKIEVIESNNTDVGEIKLER